MTQVMRTQNLSIGFTFARKPDFVVASNLSLSLPSGRLVCLLGPNGAGKSTLMRTIAGMQPPIAGDVFLGEDNIRILSAAERAKRLSVVLTDRPNLGLLNGYALVSLGRHPYTDWTGRLTSYDEAVVRWAVEAVNAVDLANRPVMDLSDGQRQKLMIARALAQETALMLLDEPTAFLDLPRRVEIMHLLNYLASETDRSILVSTHDLDLALRSADEIWLIADGRVVTGIPEDLILNGIFEQTFNVNNVRFDRETGSFTLHTRHHGFVSLIGEGIPATWTRRALERKGFIVKSNSDTEVAIVDSDGQHTWHLARANNRTTHTSVGDLLNALMGM